MGPFVISTDDPRLEDVSGLVELHLAFANENSTAEDVHALDLRGLLDPSVTFFSARSGRELLGIGALKVLDETHIELKSMYTVVADRGRGVGRAILIHLIGVAREGGYRRVSLETGAADAFATARSLYTRAGFTFCSPFGDYAPSPNSVCMTLPLR